MSDDWQQFRYASRVAKRGNWIPLRPKILRNDLLNHTLYIVHATYADVAVNTSAAVCLHSFIYLCFFFFSRSLQRYFIIIISPHLRISLKLSKPFEWPHNHCADTTSSYSNWTLKLHTVYFSFVSHTQLIARLFLSLTLYLKSYAMNVSVEMLNAPMA